MGSDWDSVASHQDGFLTPVNSCFPVCPNTQQRAGGALVHKIEQSGSLARLRSSCALRCWQRGVMGKERERCQCAAGPECR